LQARRRDDRGIGGSDRGFDRFERRPDLGRFGSVRFGSVRFGSVRFGSVRFESVRFGSDRFGSVRFGSDRFGLDLLGPRHVAIRLGGGRHGSVVVLRLSAGRRTQGRGDLGRRVRDGGLGPLEHRLPRLLRGVGDLRDVVGCHVRP
jgi:hypothetical protein